MIRDRVIVTRYAEAFLSYARANCGTEKALADLIVVKNIIRDHPDLQELLGSPEISYNEKCAVIDEVLKDGPCDDMRNFLKLLLEKKRFDKFLDIADYIRSKYSHHGQVDALLKTAFPLDLEVIKDIENALRKRFKYNLRFYIDLDGSLLGGVQVIIGNTIIDGSVRKRLDELKEKLSALRLD